jgi:hypothetical protein
MDPLPTCGNCNGDVLPEAQSCPHCGAIFDATMACRVHPSEEADGVCAICAIPCCHECGLWVNDIFLCGKHETYEIMEEQARVFGSMDVLVAEYAVRCLEEAGLHPFLFSRSARRNPSIPSNFGFRQYNGHTAAEMKVLVPYAEVDRAEEILRDLTLPPS